MKEVIGAFVFFALPAIALAQENPLAACIPGLASASNVAEITAAIESAKNDPKVATCIAARAQTSTSNGYSLPLLHEGQAYWPDFLVWVDKAVIVIDTNCLIPYQSSFSPPGNLIWSQDAPV